MNSLMRYRVIQAHRSEYPAPITFCKGTILQVGKPDQGLEGWWDWYFCETPGQQGGWVPAQVFKMMSDGIAIAIRDYTARELDVEPGDILYATQHLNGWAWCELAHSPSSGWVPQRNLQPLDCPVL